METALGSLSLVSRTSHTTEVPGKTFKYTYNVSQITAANQTHTRVSQTNMMAGGRVYGSHQ